MNDLVRIETPPAMGEYLSSAGEPKLTFRQGQFYLDGEPIKLGTKFLARMRDHRIGFQRWADGLPTESRMGYLWDDFVPPARHTLGDDDESKWEAFKDGTKRDPWQKNETVPMLSMDGTEVLFASGSWGGHTALVAFQKAYRRNGASSDPLIELATKKKANQYGGVNDVPVFKVIGWAKPQGPAPLQLTTGNLIDDEIPF